jgi:hypothetical protein
MSSSKTLLSPEEAAGYTMAFAPDDDFTAPATLDDALRHGHSAAARKTQPAALTESLQNAVSHWWNGNGKAHA